MLHSNQNASNDFPGKNKIADQDIKGLSKVKKGSNTKKQLIATLEAMDRLISVIDVKEIKKILTELIMTWLTSDIDVDQGERLITFYRYKGLMELLNFAESVEVEKRDIPDQDIKSFLNTLNTKYSKYPLIATLEAIDTSIRIDDVKDIENLLKDLLNISLASDLDYAPDMRREMLRCEALIELTDFAIEEREKGEAEESGLSKN